MLNIATDTQAFLNGRLLVQDTEKKEWLVRATIPAAWLQSPGPVKRVIDSIRSEYLACIPPDTDTRWIITIPQCGPSGFSCDLWGSGRASEVKMLFGALEDTCNDLETALNWLGRALSDSYRLRTRRNKNRILSVGLEQVDADDTAPFIEMGYGLWPFASRSHQEGFQQNALSLGRD